METNTATAEPARFLTKADAFLHSSTEGGIIMVSRVIDRQPGRTLGRLIFTDWYVVDFGTVEAAYEAGMEIEADFGDLEAD